MNREVFLETLKDLALTLRSPNFENEVIKKRWQEKYEKFQKSIDNLTREDIEELDVKFNEWLKETVSEAEIEKYKDVESPYKILFEELS